MLNKQIMLSYRFHCHHHHRRWKLFGICQPSLIFLVVPGSLWHSQMASLVKSNLVRQFSLLLTRQSSFTSSQALVQVWPNDWQYLSQVKYLVFMYFARTLQISHTALTSGHFDTSHPPDKKISKG